MTLCFLWHLRAMIWCLKRRCQHLSSKWRTCSFMNCLRCLQCTEWKGGTGCGLPTGAIWKCVTGKVLGPSCGMWTQPTVNCCDSPTDCDVCVWVCMWNVRQRNSGREGKRADWIENPPHSVFTSGLTPGLLLKQLIISLSYFPTPLWWDPWASGVGGTTWREDPWASGVGGD